MKFIPSLFKSNSEDLFMFKRSRNIIRIDLNDIIISFFLLLQKFQSFRFVSRCDHSI